MAATSPTLPGVKPDQGARSGANIAIATRAFLAICWRDIFVTGRQLPVFLAQVLLQPIFFLYIFGKILPSGGLTSTSYGNLLLPGIIALTIVTTGLQSTALPLVLEFSFTKEIEDRLLAPLPVAMVAVQKIVIAAVRALIGGIVIFPLGVLILGNELHLSGDHIGAVVVFCLLASFIGASLGMSMGTLVEQRQINIMFALVLTPLLFTGCTQYPWSLLDNQRWFQILTLFNPMTYASEGLRGALDPSVPHINPWIAALAALVAVIGFSALGIWGFVRRAVD